jgi:diguanylate cyclase (GGDEF)-like protein
MARFQELPISRKLMLIIMGTCAVALVATAVGLVTYELLTFRDDVTRDLSTIAEVMAVNTSAALYFEVPDSAEEILRVLDGRAHVNAACLYTAGGDIFASFVRAGSGSACPAAPLGSGHAFNAGSLSLWRPVLHEAQPIGSILIDSDLSDLYERITSYAQILAVVVATSTLLAFGISSRLRRMVADPVLKLAETARVVSENKDYSVRATVSSHDEVGVLIGAFNEMLTQIEARDEALTDSFHKIQETQDGLYERTQELEAANRDLEREISERERAEERARVLAFHDALTGLPNRLLFNDRLKLALSQADRHHRKLAVLFVDLDRFKLINDSLGHSLGDILLRQVADRLITTVRHSDTVARLGGDEFTLLLPELHGPEDAARTARKILRTIRKPFSLEGREVFATPSIGIAMFPEDGEDVDTLLKNADTAMYRAKDEGRDNFQLYTSAMNVHALKRLSLESGLRRALPNRELRLWYQPVVNLADGEIHGFEALLRWQHPMLGLVPPSEFVPVAEATGLIVPIGPWVLRTACEQVRAWQETSQRPLSVAVNLSARQFEQSDLTEQITRALDDTGLPPESLELEIVESSAMRNAESAIKTLAQIKSTGVRISIDDFGVGYSSLSYLRRLPIDTLKIDRSFVRDITIDPGDAAIVTAVVGLARTLKLRVVAEGVETREQLDFLRRQGCDRMQGFLMSAPLPPADCLSFIESSRVTWAGARGEPGH